MCISLEEPLLPRVIKTELLQNAPLWLSCSMILRSVPSGALVWRPSLLPLRKTQERESYGGAGRHYSRSQLCFGENLHINRNGDRKAIGEEEKWFK